MAEPQLWLLALYWQKLRILTSNKNIHSDPGTSHEQICRTKTGCVELNSKTKRHFCMLKINAKITTLFTFIV